MLAPTAAVRRDGCLFLELCIKFGSDICIIAQSELWPSTNENCVWSRVVMGITVNLLPS